MSAKALICGSLAYDTIMVFPDKFKRHILPDQVHILNVAFLVPNMRKEFGGCAGNIAYNLKMLGGSPYPVATVGKDFQPYEHRFKSLGIPLDFVRTIPEQFTAQAFITTDLDDNQITAFHPGAMNDSYLNTTPGLRGDYIGLVGPDGAKGMKAHADCFAKQNIPFIFDPGQAMPLFDGPDFLHFVELANWITVNDYESKLLTERTGLSEDALAQKVSAYIVTRGAKGCDIYTRGEKISVDAVKISKVADPTGCGDAFRAGLLHGIANQLPIETSVKLASLLGGIKVESAGTQNHTFTHQSLAKRYVENYHEDYPIQHTG